MTPLLQRLLPSVLLATLVASSGVSQSQPPTPMPAPASVLTAFGSMGGTLQDLQVPAAPIQAFTVDVVLGESVQRLRLHPHDVRSQDFKLLVDDGTAVRQVPAPPSVTWRGDVAGDPDSTVAASVIQGALEALVMLSPEDGYWGIQPLREVDPNAPADRYFVYHSSDNANTSHRCGVPNPTGPLPTPMGGDSGTILVCEIAIDADYQYFLINNSNVTSTQNDVTSVINGVDAIYLRDTEITYQITTILVRTSLAATPYTSSSASTLLGQFANHWAFQQGAIQRDVAHLFTGRSLFGSVIGIAISSGICSNTRGYALSESRFTSIFGARVALTAHELGHNWSAQHCDTVNDCRIMCSGLGGCSRNLSSFAPVSISSILAHKSSRNCLSIFVRTPFLSIITPSTVRAFQAPSVTLTGSGFNGVSSINVGATTVTTGFTVVNDTTITLFPPTAPVLGQVSVTVTNAAGTSNARPLTYTATTPPILDVPSVAVNGFPLRMGFGGQPNHLYVVITGLGNTTTPFQGFPILQSFSILTFGTLDAVGVGSFSVPLPATGGFNQVQIHSQMIEGDPMTLQLTGASGVESTTLFL